MSSIEHATTPTGGRDDRLPFLRAMGVVALIATVIGLVVGAGYVPSYSQDYLDRKLVDASTRGDVAGARWFLRLGADPNRTFRMTRSALTAAAIEEHTEMAELLLAHGADPNLSSSYDGPPLTAAARYGNADMVRLLLAHGADVVQPDVTATTALMHAAKDDSLDIVQTLLARGGAPGQGIDEALRIAASWDARDDRILAALLGAGVSRDAATAALVSANSPARAQALLDAGAVIDGGRIPSIMGASSNQELIRFLLAHGADLEARDPEGRTALLNTEWPPTIRFLIDAGADREARNNAGDTALLAALRGARLDAARTLIESGADVNVLDANRRTPLMIVTENCNVPMVRLLLAKGADPSRRTPTGQTAADLASARKRLRHVWCQQWDVLVATLTAGQKGS